MHKLPYAWPPYPRSVSLATQAVARCPQTPPTEVPWHISRLSRVTQGTATPLTPLHDKEQCLGCEGASTNGGTPKAAPPNLHAGASSSDSLHSTDSGRQGLGACQKASPAVWGAPSEVRLN